ncbi:hypothetical protein AB8A20_15885 [Tardiphaga sp. 604_B6_N1_1]|uniref:hypothetical protein n=1 Tax=Tardiphaga sp. 604_B6_N1_1 TaxID=3240779 RepID=UPI003F22D0EF
MNFRFSISKLSFAQLKFEKDPPFDPSDKEFTAALRDVEENCQSRRIPVSIENEVVGEFYLFYALLWAHFETIEVIRVEGSPVISEIEVAKKRSAEVPIRDRNGPRGSKDALKMLELEIMPPEPVSFYTKILAYHLSHGPK